MNQASLKPSYEEKRMSEMRTCLIDLKGSDGVYSINQAFNWKLESVVTTSILVD